MLRITTALFLIGLLAGCSKMEGVYKLDGAETTKATKALMPVDRTPGTGMSPEGLQRLGMQLRLTAATSSEMTLELLPGGKAKMLEKGAGKTPSMKETSGTWTKEGDGLLLDMGSGKPRRCAKKSGKLVCEPPEDGDLPLVFAKG